MRPTESALVTALCEHVQTLQAELADEKARAIGAEAQLADANARADKAIAALGTLADKIAKLAEERTRRPWWKRALAG